MPDNAERAQRARINRRLEATGQTLRKIREDSRWYSQYGPYTVVDIGSNAILASAISDLDALETTLAEHPAAS